MEKLKTCSVISIFLGLLVLILNAIKESWRALLDSFYFIPWGMVFVMVMFLTLLVYGMYFLFLTGVDYQSSKAITEVTNFIDQ